QPVRVRQRLTNGAAWPIISLEARRRSQQRAAVTSDPVPLRHSPVHFARLDPVVTVQQFSHKFALGSAAFHLKRPSCQTFDGVTDIEPLAAPAESPKVLGCLTTAVG